jgi:hypothetical protein
VKNPVCALSCTTYELGLYVKSVNPSRNLSTAPLGVAACCSSARDPAAERGSHRSFAMLYPHPATSMCSLNLSILTEAVMQEGSVDPGSCELDLTFRHSMLTRRCFRQHSRAYDCGRIIRRRRLSLPRPCAELATASSSYATKSDPRAPGRPARGLAPFPHDQFPTERHAAVSEACASLSGAKQLRARRREPQQTR